MCDASYTIAMEFPSAQSILFEIGSRVAVSLAVIRKLQLTSIAFSSSGKTESSDCWVRAWTSSNDSSTSTCYRSPSARLPSVGPTPMSFLAVFAFQAQTTNRRTRKKKETWQDERGFFKGVLDYVTRRFNPESIRGWDTALRDLQIQLEPRVSRSEAAVQSASWGWFPVPRGTGLQLSSQQPHLNKKWNLKKWQLYL